MKKIIVLVIILALMLSACNSTPTIETTQVPTVEITATVEPTVAVEITSTPEPTPTIEPTATPEPVLEAFDSSYENGDRSNISVAVKGDDIFYIFSNNGKNRYKGVLYGLNTKSNKEIKINKVMLVSERWSKGVQYRGNVKVIDNYLYYNSQYGLRRMNIDTKEKEDIVTNEEMFEIANARITDQDIIEDNGIENFIIHNNKIYFRFITTHKTDYIYYNTVGEVNLNEKKATILDGYIERLIYTGNIFRDNIIFSYSNIFEILNNRKRDVFSIERKAYDIKTVLSEDKIFFSSCRYLDDSGGSDIQGYDINTYEEIYYEEYEYDRIYIESANQYIFKFFFDEEWTPITMSLMDTKNDVEYSKDELREHIVGDFELEQFYNAYWCMEDGAMYLCSPSKTEDTAFLKIYKMTIEDGKMVFEHLYTHEESID